MFRTLVELPLPSRKIALADGNVFLGSCFAEHVGRCFADARLRACVNPLGVLYNPLSVSRILQTSHVDETCDIVSDGGMWHFWLGDTLLSRPSEKACVEAAEHAMEQLHGALSDAANLFLTLGTSHCYVYKKTGRVVANCHRVAAVEFDEVELTQEEMVSSLNEALVGLHERNPRLRVVFTISPYRYAKYGFHESQLSKASLLLAAEQLRQWHPDWIDYFPAYEILLDELRDYRFYAEDMLHPSAQAVRYIWQRLCETWMSDEVNEYLVRWEPLERALRHCPVNPYSPASATFRQHTLTQLEQLQRDYPMLSFPSLNSEPCNRLAACVEQRSKKNFEL